MTQEFLTLRELCDQTGLSARTVQGYLAANDITKAHSLGRQHVYNIKILKGLRESHTPQTKLTVAKRLASLEHDMRILKEQQRDR